MFRLIFLSFLFDVASQLIDKIRRNHNASQRWEECRVLLIDEISMIDGNLFDKLEEIARAIRDIKTPFGGIQVVLSGDFLQLPPVATGGTHVPFCFQAASFTRVVQVSCELQTVFRQKEHDFVQTLGELRRGQITAAGQAMLQDRVGKAVTGLPEGIEPSRLYPTKSQVGHVNEQRLAAIQEELVTFHALDSGPQWALDNIQRNCPAPVRNI